jgi:hypothetical protein
MTVLVVFWDTAKMTRLYRCRVIRFDNDCRKKLRFQGTKGVCAEATILDLIELMCGRQESSL